MGPQLRFECDEVIAITGGDLSPSLDGKPIPSYAAVEVKAGQTLRFGAPKSGCRAYIAVAGGFDLPKVMGSQSTYMKAALGGLEGRKLQKAFANKLSDGINESDMESFRRTLTRFGVNLEDILRHGL